MQVAARRRSSMTRFTARSMRWMRSSDLGPRSPSTGSLLDQVHLHETVGWIVDAADHRAAVLLEPPVETGAVGGDFGRIRIRIRIKVVAHARIDQDNVWGDSCQ